MLDVRSGITIAFLRCEEILHDSCNEHGRPQTAMIKSPWQNGCIPNVSLKLKIFISSPLLLSVCGNSSRLRILLVHSPISSFDAILIPSLLHLPGSPSPPQNGL